MVREDGASFYDKDAKTYDKRWVSPGGTYTNNRQQTIIRTFIKDWDEDKVLEVGCGTGRFSKILLRSAKSLYYLDLSFEMLNLFQDKMGGLSVDNLNVTNASVYRLPFSDSSFDGLVSINVINHLEEFKYGIKEFSRVLKQGGKLIVNFANYHSYYMPAAIPITLRNKALGKNVYSNWHSIFRIKKLLTNEGFKLIKTIGNVHIPKSLDIMFVRDILILLDSISSESLLRYLSPNVFIYMEKNKCLLKSMK